MYRFVCNYDYTSLIKDAIKTMVTDANDQVRHRAEQFAREEIEGYLNLEYNVDRILNHQVYDFAANATHQVNDLIIKSDGTQYVCIEANANTNDIDNATKFVKEDLSKIKIYDVAVANTKGDTVVGPDKVKYLCIKDAPAGTSLFDTEYFYTKRNDLIVMLYCDIAIYHYHARINPNQVPQLRVDRYMDAQDKLKRIRRKELTPAIPRADRNDDGEPDTGAMVFVANQKRGNGW